MKKWEVNHRNEIALNSPDNKKNYIIEAGAGGGKTTLLINRIVNQIIAGTPIESFIVITYTNAAKNEMLERIIKSLREKHEEYISDQLNPNSQEKASVISAAIDRIELMNISTIHSFLLGIIKEFNLEANVSTDVKVLDEDEDDTRKESFFDKWWKEHYKEIVQRFKDVTEIEYLNGKKKDHTREILKNMFMDIANVREPIAYDLSDHEVDYNDMAKPFVETWMPILSQFKSDLYKYAPLTKTGKITIISKTRELINRISDMELKKQNLAQDDSYIQPALEVSSVLNEIYDKCDKSGNFYRCDYSLENSQILKVAPKFPKWELEWNFQKLYSYFSGAKMANMVAEYVCVMRDTYQKEIDSNTRELSNDDILYRAEKLLQENPDILAWLREKYSKIYVDEMQDTTELQTRIIRRLACGKNGRGFLKDMIVMVGDPKQSIYRFTGAEVEIMNGLFKTFRNSKYGKAVVLPSNFRSCREIVEWVNSSFGKIMPDYKAMEYESGKGDPKLPDGVYKYDVADGSYTNNKDYENLSVLIKKLVSKCGYSYKDVMVICKRARNITIIADALKDNEIPVKLQGKYRIDSDLVIKNYILLMTAIADTKNQKNKIAAAQIISGIDISKVSEQSAANAETALKEILDHIRTSGMNTAAAAEYIKEHEEWYVPRGINYNQDDVRQYRIRLNQMIEECLADNNGDMLEFVKKLVIYEKAEHRYESSLDSEEIAVRVMNLHQAKGLESPIVVIADRSNEEYCRYGAFRKDGKYYPVVRYTKDQMHETIVPTYGWSKDLLKTAYEEEMAESVRTEYVAATRAKNALIIMPKISKNSWFTNPAFNYSSLKDINECLDSITNAHNGDNDAPNEDDSAAVIKVSDLRKGLNTYKMGPLKSAQTVVFNPSNMEDFTGVYFDEDDIAPEDRPMSTVFGKVLHNVFERVINRYDKIKSMSATDRSREIEKIINIAIMNHLSEMDISDENNVKKVTDYLKEVVDDYIDRVFGPIMQNAEEVHTEYEFSFYVPESEREWFLNEFSDNEDEGGLLLVKGVADLVVISKDGGTTVYDYKSDSMNGMEKASFEKMLEERYDGQLAMYRYCIGKMFNTDMVHSDIIHLYM